MKVSIVILLTTTLLLTAEDVKMPSVTGYALSGGPVVAGTLRSSLFIVVTCGAISGWHTLCCSGQLRGASPGNPT